MHASLLWGDYRDRVIVQAIIVVLTVEITGIKTRDKQKHRAEIIILLSNLNIWPGCSKEQTYHILWLG